MAQCRSRLGIDEVPREEKYRAQLLVEEMIASIPFQLNSDILSLQSETEIGGLIVFAGKPLGGLFLLHPLWVITMCSIVSDEIRARMHGCLAWIGTNMGIGQATLLAEVWHILHRSLCRQR